MKDLDRKLTPVVLMLYLLAGGIVAFYFIARPIPVPEPPTFPVVTKPAPQPAEPVVYKDLIKVDAPLSGGYVTTPLVVTGEARGTWYFEASVPVTLLDGNGKVLVETHADALSDWMTNDYVPFKATLAFAAPGTAGGTLVLHKDNPSGEPARDDEVRIPVRFNYGIVPPPQQ